MATPVKNEFLVDTSEFFSEDVLQFTDTLDKRQYMGLDLKDKLGFEDEGPDDLSDDEDGSGEDLDDGLDEFSRDLDLKFNGHLLSSFTAAGVPGAAAGGVVNGAAPGSPLQSGNSPHIDRSSSPRSGTTSPAPRFPSTLTAAAYEALDRNCRYEVILEAATAAAQRASDGPLTYLNKGQYYAINLIDKRKADVTHSTTLRVRFHDSLHQQEKNENWRIWLMQQPSRNARPMEVDKMASIGTRNVDTSEFEAIRFQWTGSRGAKVLIKLNCLSTEFSRTKGVKGIHLRLQTDTEVEDGDCESQYGRVKVFRDKGAQRKNRDDQKAVEKRLEKLMREDGTKNRDGLLVFTPPHPLTRFILDPETIVPVTTLEEVATNLPTENGKGGLPHSQPVLGLPAASPVPSNAPSAVAVAPPPLLSSSSSGSLNAPMLADGTLIPKAKSRKHEYVDLADLELEPNLPPATSRKKRPVLCLLLKTPEDPVYNAIFLERLTAEDLRRKLAERCGLDVNAITALCRITKKGLAVKVDDRMVENLEDEQDFVMESTYNSADGTVSISLR